VRGAGVVIVVNPSAGPGRRADPTDQLRRDLPDAEVVELDDGVLASAARRADTLGVAGGDGTVNAAAAAAYDEGKPLLVVPGGTLNHFARDLGVESVDDAVAAVSQGSTVEVDVGTIAGRPFLNTASFGAYVDLVDARERLERWLGKWPAAVVALVVVFLRTKPVDVEIDGRRSKVWLAFVGNCAYEPAGFAPVRRSCLADGELDIRVVERTHRLGRPRLRSWKASQLRVRSLDGPLRLARDGETFDGPEEFVVTKAERRLRVFGPGPDAV
jgi:undecaprenyl-diphosphatase